MAAEASEYLFYMLAVQLQVVRINKDVIKVDHDKDIEHICEDTVDEPLEGSQHIICHQTLPFISQPSLLIPTPLATAVWDWSAVPDSAIQSNSDNDEAVAKAKYNKRQHWKKVQKDQKAAEEAVAWERAEAEPQEREVAELHRQEEAECWEREENEHQEKEENECQEREVNKHREWEVQAWVASQIEGRGSQSCDPEEQCMPASTKKVWKHVVLAESMSLRDSEKKKHAQAKSLEVEVVGGSSQAKKGKSVACDTSITGGLYAIATAIDWHTEEMAQLRQMVRTLGSSHHHVIESMAELLQEMTYPELELPAESGSEESEEAKALDKLGQK
ncbi:hypothetical protein EDD16DRAFT_1717944 [Pisolithus croceorrhizus]|nr:hypothetical protein EDD16DRAFT_1717944 [Pisolithus croceorrhizus]KAI6168263.1 hypothetical protein EDD17DRAFT_1750864 [Pisolithus thermaeus]